AEFFQGIMDAVKLPDDVKAAVRSALAARDFVALESLLEDTPLKSAEHELLLRFPALRGGAEILDAAGGLVRNRRSEAALAELAWGGPGLSTALRLGSTLRLFGMRAVVDTEARSTSEANAWWHAVGAANLVHCLSDSVVAWSATGQRTRRLPPEQVAARLAG